MNTAEAQKINDSYRNSFPKSQKINRTKHNLPINERLKIVRNAKGMSSARVVAALQKKGINIGHSSLQGYEANEASLNHRYPSLPTLIALSDFYGCSMDYLFGLTDKIERPRAKKKIQPKLEYDLEEILETEDFVFWSEKKINSKQRELISAQIEFILARTI